MELTRYIYVTLCLFACCGVTAQDPVCRNITNLNGLPSNTVYYLLQDNRGFIWLAHDRGLSRYDGREFKQYSTGSQVGRSLSNLVQVGNEIWCQDFSGNFYYTRGDSLVPEPAIKTQGTFIATSVVGGNTLVSCKQDSLRQFNITQRKYLAVHNPHNFLPAQCAADGGLYFLSTGSVLFYQNGHTRPVQTLPGRLPRFFYLVKNESGFAALTRDTYPYVYFIGRNGITAQPLLQPGIFIQDVCVVEEEIWISTSAGAWCFTKNWQPKYGGRCFYAGSSITRIMKDREGSYWFG
ncbi:MAG: hypothetical protein JNM68_05895, partial [Dinghuibacter sp.]|nr:hypothetical protein [Dinghuibacter sp.]